MCIRDSPSVVALRKQVKEARSVMDRQKSDRTQVKRGLNKNRQELELSLMEAQVNLSSAQARVEALASNRDKALSEMKSLNNYETKLASLYRNLAVAEENFRVYSEKREEARINLELDRQHISNVKTVQPATIQVKHVSPKYGLVVLASCFFALVGSLCVAIFAEQIDSSLKTEPVSYTHLTLPTKRIV